MADLKQELEKLGGDITTALQDVGVPATLLDRQGVIRWENQAARERYGGHAGEPISRVISPNATNDAEALLADILCTGQPAEFTLPVALPEGGVELIDVSAAPVRDGGAVVGVFGLSKGARSTPSRRKGGTSQDMTRRQREVLALLAEGLSTSEIAARLAISETTVRNHVANLLATLGAHTRLQAVIKASRAGLI